MSPEERKRYKVAIVGCGNIAGRFDEARPQEAPPLTHAGAFTNHSGFEVVACVDPDDSRRQAFQGHWHIPHAFADMESLRTLDSDIDVLSICSPTFQHAQDLHDALALMPRLVFCEKPLTPDLQTATHWVQALESAGITMAVNHTRRWSPDLTSFAQELRMGSLGTLRSVSATYTKGILNNGSHLIDLLHDVLGPLTLHAVGRPVVDHTDADPSAPFLLYAGDVPVQVSIGDARDFAMFEINFVTSQGVWALEEGGRQWRIRRAQASTDFAAYKVLGASTACAGQYDLSMRAAVQDIHDSLSKGLAPRCTGREALAAQALCDQIRHLACNCQ